MNPFWHCWWLDFNLVQLVEKPWGENNQRYFLFHFLFFAFWWNFCHVNTMMFVFFLLLLFLLFFWDWLTTLWISAHPQPRSTSTHIKSPQTSQMSYFHASFCVRQWRKIYIFIHFCTWLKRSDCAKSLSTQNYHTNVVLNVLLGCRTKERHLDSKQYKFWLWSELKKNREKNRKKNKRTKKAGLFQDLYCHDYSVDGWTVLKVCFVVFWNGSFSYYACLTDQAAVKVAKYTVLYLYILI